jgi:arylsulfatase A-like enzyme
MLARTLLIAFTGLLSTASPRSGVSNPSGPSVPPNIVLIVLDDVGLDKLSLYGSTPATGSGWDHTLGSGAVLTETLPAMPTLSWMASEGVRFRHAYSTPLCSPTRAQLLSGRYGHQTGMLHLTQTGTPSSCSGGYPLPHESSPGVPIGLLPQVLKGVGYSTGAFGKWHLAGDGTDLDHPAKCGFDLFVGHMQNNEPTAGQATPNHYSWTRVVKQRGQAATVHAETEFDARKTRTFARGFIERQVAAHTPYFAYVAFNPPHAPFQPPPPETIMNSPTSTYADIKALNGWSDADYANKYKDTLASPPTDCDTATPAHFEARLYYRAQLEAIDWEIRQLLGTTATALTDLANTIILVVGDNGTVAATMQTVETCALPQGAPYPANHGKRFLYEQGIAVPLVVYGPPQYVSQAGQPCDGLVSTVDFWRTLCDLAGATPTIPTDSDSRSFASWLIDPQGTPPPSVRTTVYQEIASRNGFTYAGSTWSPQAPASQPACAEPVTYWRTAISSTGQKYIRRCTPDGATGTPLTCLSGAPLSTGACSLSIECGVPDPCGVSCPPGGPVAPLPREEFYQVFGADPNEVLGACSVFTTAEKNLLRCTISDHSGN